MKKIAIVGANSDIAKCFTDLAAEHCSEIILIGRKLEELEQQKLRLSGLIDKIETCFCDFEETSEHLIEKVVNFQPSLIFISFGVEFDQESKNLSDLEIDRTVKVNFLTKAKFIQNILEKANPEQKLQIIVISSIAGERGRAVNYWYGASKAALTAFLSGVRQKYSNTAISIHTIKPGFVDTKFLRDKQKSRFLLTSPEYLAAKIYAKVSRKSSIIYPNLRWASISLTIKLIPEFIFKQLRF